MRSSSCRLMTLEQCWLSTICGWNNLRTSGRRRDPIVIQLDATDIENRLLHVRQIALNVLQGGRLLQRVMVDAFLSTYLYPDNKIDSSLQRYYDRRQREATIPDKPIVL